MVTKIGYGFHADDLANENNEQILLSFIQKYDYNLYLEIKEEMYSNKGKYCLDIILNCISQYYTTFAEYIQNIINTEERKFANLNKGDMVLQLCDNFLVYIPNIFIKDNLVALYVRDEKIFQNIIHRYFPETKIHFGYIFTGEDWLDDEYYFDE